MHAVFMLYGIKYAVERLLRDMESQKLQMTLRKKGEEDKKIWIDCQVRILPLGLYEFIFPKEYVDMVLTTLDFHKKDVDYNLGQEVTFLKMRFKPLNYIKKFLKIEDIPEFKTDKLLVWNRQFVSIIPIGVRYDRDRTASDGEELKGWTHEAI